MRPCSGSRVNGEHVPKLCRPSSGEHARHACVAVSGGGGDQHLTPGLVCKRETRLRAQEETGLEPPQRTKAEHQQELAGSADLQCVSAAQRCLFTKLRHRWASVGVLLPRKHTDVVQNFHISIVFHSFFLRADWFACNFSLLQSCHLLWDACQNSQETFSRSKSCPCSVPP